MLKEIKNHVSSIYNNLVEDVLKWNPIKSVLYKLINILREERVMEGPSFEYFCIPL